MKIKIYLSIALISVLAAIACDTVEPGNFEEPKTNTSSISFTGCNTDAKSTEAYSPAIRLISLDTNYLLIYAINTEFSCGTDSISILDSIQGKDISTEIIDHGPFSFCYCPHNVEFSIGPLLNTNYTLKFIESVTSYTRDTFIIDFTYTSHLDTLVTKKNTSDMISKYPLGYSKTELGGCNGMLKSTEINNEEKNDTLIFHEQSDTLKIYVGLNLTCCIEFGSESEIISDTLVMRINTLNDEFCDCICYYEFDYYYLNYIKQGFYYQFYIDNYKRFEGIYNVP